ncbi:hypothetical protein QNI16_36535 [Cytophagaceae bacterium YF14B1]|uniref:Disease resistance R13L4/SHOC-2-like LRR domain-containing protein n=1 Tax=Xanthocytophaga flava TaxID=3048013 RepID=A0AAE3UBS4_9BACT|nr:hypothetical protein [Xanthocytophaga flavus]MDJ1486047.1 hypothetical protein [Xanthocytophaga flavus]
MENEVENLKRLLLSTADENVKLGLTIWQNNADLAITFSKSDRKHIYKRIAKNRELVLYCLQSDFPEPIQRIQKLDLRHSNLKDLPASVAKLPYLNELDLRYNELQVVPEVVGKLKSLKKLELGMNEFSQIPEEIFHLKNLRYLCFCSNSNFKLDIDSPITQMAKIELLCISEDQLSERLKDKLKELRPQIVFQ